jgi:integrase
MCHCRGEDGRRLGAKCPKLRRGDGSPNYKHGSGGWAMRIPTTSGTKLVKRFGYRSGPAIDAGARQAKGLLALAGADTITRAKIGDLIVAARRGRPLPSLEDVRRRLLIGADPGTTGVTFGQAWAAWLAGKRRLRRSSRERLAQIGEHWLLPVLADVPLEKMNGGHCAAVFERIERINTALAAQRAGGRAWARVEDDVRTRPKLVGVAAQHRVFAALREFCNYEMKVTNRLDRNPVYAVELPPEVTPEAQTWTAEQAHVFLAASEGDPLHLLFRIVLLFGPRRGEAIGLRWSGLDTDAGYVLVERPILLIGKDLDESAPKTRAGHRIIWLDAKTIGLLKKHRDVQQLERQYAGEAWQDHDLIFCRDDGSPYRPDVVYRRFRAIAKRAGLPPIKLHEGRHSAVSLQYGANVNPELTQRTVGHAKPEMTRHYTHPEAQAYRAAAEATAAQVDRGL